ncbi:hypothetical protein ACA910_015778 [Epithemia clementina (nom. ined.)]
MYNKATANNGTRRSKTPQPSSSSLWKTAHSLPRRLSNPRQKKVLLPPPNLDAVDVTNVPNQGSSLNNNNDINESKLKTGTSKNQRKGENVAVDTGASSLFTSRHSELSVFDRLYNDAQRRADKQAQMAPTTVRCETFRGFSSVCGDASRSSWCPITRSRSPSLFSSPFRHSTNSVDHRKRRNRVVALSNGHHRSSKTDEKYKNSKSQGIDSSKENTAVQRNGGARQQQQPRIPSKTRSGSSIPADDLQQQQLQKPDERKDFGDDEGTASTCESHRRTPYGGSSALPHGSTIMVTREDELLPPIDNNSNPPIVGVESQQADLRDGVSSISSNGSEVSGDSALELNPPSLLFPARSVSNSSDGSRNNRVLRKNALVGGRNGSSVNLLLTTTSEERRRFLFSGTCLQDKQDSLTSSPTTSSFSGGDPSSAFERLYRNEYASSASRRNRTSTKVLSPDSHLSRRLNYRPSTAQLKHPVSLRTPRPAGRGPAKAPSPHDNKNNEPASQSDKNKTI